MKASQPTHPALADFLQTIRRGDPPLESLACGRAGAWADTRFCSSEQAAELAQIAHRPPRGLRLYKFGSRSVVGSFLLKDGSATVLKYYFPKGPHKQLSYGFTGSRCLQSWTAALAFHAVGLPTPAALAIAEWHRLGGRWWSQSFLATRQAGGISLFDWVDLHEREPSRLAAMAERLHLHFTRMADYRIGHGDLKASNILVAEDGSLSFLDLDAATLLCSSRRWPACRARDQRIFAGNWKRHPHAAKAFAQVLC